MPYYSLIPKLITKISLNRSVVSFSGNSYMRFVTPAILKGNSSTSIMLTIRPDSGNGIIIYAEKVGHEKFFALTLKNASLELRYYTVMSNIISLLLICS